MPFIILNEVVSRALSLSIDSKDVHLNVLEEYQRNFPDIHIGYSGHELGFIPTLGAVAKGAKVIERHFTLDKSLKGIKVKTWHESVFSTQGYLNSQIGKLWSYGSYVDLMYTYLSFFANFLFFSFFGEISGKTNSFL